MTIKIILLFSLISLGLVAFFILIYIFMELIYLSIRLKAEIRIQEGLVDMLDAKQRSINEYESMMDRLLK